MEDLLGRVLVITGANGFVGQHVAASATARGATVWAIAREDEPSPGLAKYCDDYFPADLETEWPIAASADAVIHLAGLAAVGPSFSQPQRYLSVNSGIMTTICEALLSSKSHARLVAVSSGSVYAPPVLDAALDEESPTRPGSPYGVAKLLVELQATYYSERGVDVVVMRPFNHIGPGQGEGFLVPDLTTAVEALEKGTDMQVGNLAAERDFTDVRDVADAYLKVAFGAKHHHRLYNVASGAARSGYEVLEAIATALGRPVPPLELDPSRLRPNDPSRIVGSAARLRKEFGWAPTIDWRQSISDFIRLRKAF